MQTRSVLEFALLGLLRQKAQSGYDLRKAFVSTPWRHFSDSPGSIYPALGRLQARHWVKSVRQNGNNRQRQEFSVTPAGTRALVDWLGQTITRDDVIWGLDEVMLRFAFLDGNVERTVTRRLVEELEQALSGYIQELRDYEKAFDAEVRSTTGYLAFQGGVDSYESRLRWVRAVRKKLMEVSS